MITIALFLLLQAAPNLQYWQGKGTIFRPGHQVVNAAIALDATAGNVKIIVQHPLENWGPGKAWVVISILSGSIMITAWEPTWGTIIITPGDPRLVDYYRRFAGGTHTAQQFFRVTRTNATETEVETWPEP
jgi:hypothetical protein